METISVEPQSADQSADPITTMAQTTVTISATDLEDLLLQIWRKTLQIAEVGCHDNFFDLGGHSLAIVKVYDQVRAALPDHPAIARLELVEMFEHPTIDALVTFLLRDTKSGGTRRSRQIKKTGAKAMRFSKSTAQGDE